MALPDVNVIACEPEEVTVPAPSPSQVVWAARGDSAGGSVRGGARPGVVATAARILAGEDWRHAIRELLDGLRDGQVLDLEEPARVTPQVDAYLAAVVEHWCARRAIAPPAWVGQECRFLDVFWWPSDNEAFTAVCLVQSPAAFRRRGIFIGATTIDRV